MKKSVLVLGLLLVMSSAAFAALDVALEVGQYNLNNTSKTGIGAQVGLPILPIPMVDTRLEVMYVPLDSSSSFVPININGSVKLPMLPLYAGAGIGYLLYSNSAAGFTAPGAMTYNIHAGYIYDLAPLTSLFAQLAYEGGRMDYTILGNTYTFQLNGLSIKGGIRVGI